MCYHGIYTFEKTQKSVQGLFGDIFVFPTIFRDNSLSMCLHREKLIEVVKNVCNAKRTPRFWKVFLMTKSQQLCRLEVVEQTTSLVWRLLIPIEKIGLRYRRDFPLNRSLPRRTSGKKAKKFTFMELSRQLPLTIQKTTYNFYQVSFESSLLILFISVCNNWSPGFRRISLVEGKQQNFL